MLVELDIFSGRPNPRWSVAEPIADEFRGLVSRLTVATDRLPPKIPGLGYRGFIFTDDTGRSRAYRGYVIRSDVILADPSSSIERFLLDRLPGEFQELRPRVALELEAN